MLTVFVPGDRGVPGVTEGAAELIERRPDITDLESQKAKETRFWAFLGRLVGGASTLAFA
jgi:hypothetical protein